MRDVYCENRIDDLLKSLIVIEK